METTCQTPESTVQSTCLIRSSVRPWQRLAAPGAREPRGVSAELLLGAGHGPEPGSDGNGWGREVLVRRKGLQPQGPEALGLGKKYLEVDIEAEATLRHPIVFLRRCEGRTCSSAPNACIPPPPVDEPSPGLGSVRAAGLFSGSAPTGASFLGKGLKPTLEYPTKWKGC